MTWFGDIYIPWITEKDTSIDREVIEKNFVGESPQVYEFNPDLESGTYSIVLNEKIHPLEESFKEQRDSILSMTDRHGTEFPFNVGGDIGFALVNSSSVNMFPSAEIQRGEIEARFLPLDSYNSSIVFNPSKIKGEFNINSSDSLVAFPSEVDISQSPEYTINSEDGQIDLYKFDSRTILSILNDENLSEFERQSICRVFNSLEERIYSDQKEIDTGSNVDNSVIKVEFSDSFQNVFIWDSGWKNIGRLVYNYETGFARENFNDKINVETNIDYNLNIYRGLPLFHVTFSNRTAFDFEPENQIVSSSDNEYYLLAEDSEGNEIIIIRFSQDGEFNQSDFLLAVEDLEQQKEYDVIVGYVPESIEASVYADYLYNIGSRRRTFTEK